MQKNKIITILISCIFILGISYSVIMSNKKHIDGNIINLPITAINAQNNRLMSPWSYSGIQAHIMFRTLFLADHTLNNFAHDLAKSYSIEDDGLTYIIELKDKQLWSDGTIITPEDIVFSINSILISEDTYVNPVLIKAFKKIRDIKIDGNTMHFQLFDSYYNFIPALAQFVIVPKHILEDTDMAYFHTSDYLKNPVVSGMYVLEEIVEDSHFVLVQNTNYQGDKPKIDEVRLYMNYKSAPIDYFYTNHISEMTHFRANKNFVQYPLSMNFIRYFVFNLQGDDGYFNPLLQDKRVREAICLSIDNAGLVEKIYFDIGASVFSTIRSSDGFLDYDPEKAKELLKEANFDFSKTIRIAFYYRDTTAISVMNFLKSNLEEVGFKVELLQTRDSVDNLYKDRDYHILFKGLASFDNLEWFLEYDAEHPFLPKIIDTKYAFATLLYNATKELDHEKRLDIINELVLKDKELLYKFPIYSPLQVAYLNTNRLSVPKDINFANPWYISNLNFADWEIKKR